jgi:hypothetical protein
MMLKGFAWSRIGELLRVQLGAGAVPSQPFPSKVTVGRPRRCDKGALERPAGGRAL